MKFVEKYAKSFALLSVLSISTWGLGCASENSTEAPKKDAPAGAEAGSSTGGGDKAASGKKAAGDEKATEEKKDEKK